MAVETTGARASTTNQQIADPESISPNQSAYNLGAITLFPSASNAPQYETELLVNELKRAMREVRHDFVGFDEIVIQTMYALLTREHQLLYSRAGTAKSLYAKSVFKHFNDSKIFKIQLTKGTTEEALVGGIDIEELKQGTIVHNTSDTLVHANFGFIDEIFDGNDVTLRSVLGILNEREFNKGKQQEVSEMHTTIAATNYIRANDVTEASTDRFVFKALLLPSQNPLDQLAIDHIYEDGCGQTAALAPEYGIPLDHITYLADLVEGKAEEKISVPEHVLAMKNMLINLYLEKINEKLRQENKTEIYISPRSIAKTRDVLNASALMCGRNAVTEEDLLSLRYIITTVGDQTQADLFKEAYEEVSRLFTPQDCATIDFLGEAHSLFRAIISQVAQGEELPMTLSERIKVFFGITTIGEQTYGKVRDVINQTEAVGSISKEMKLSLLQQINTEIERLNGTDLLAT